MNKQTSPTSGYSKNSVVFILQMLASLVVFLLGLLVIIGWHSNNSTLIQVLPSFVPMQYNTALGFLLCGVALLLLIWKYKNPLIILSIIIFALSSLTLSQYIFNINLGIDELFMRHYIGVKTSHSGRMAPNTALCFALSSIALIISVLRFRYSFSLASLIGAIITALGFVSFFGYLIDIPTAYSWGQLTAMAVHTSFGFIFIGFVIILLMRQNIVENKTGMTFYLPMLVAIGGITVTVCLWQSVYYQERANIETSVKIEANSFRNAIINEIKTRVLALERMAERWAVRNGTPRVDWELDASRYVSDYGSYQAIEWVDSDFAERWVIPLEGNEKVIGLDLAFEKQRQIALEKARDNKTSIMFRPINLVQGRKGILIYCPIFTEDKFDGFILGVLLVEDLFRSVLPDEFKDDYSINIYNENEVIFQNGVARQNAENDPFGLSVKVQESFETYGVKWKAVVSPKHSLTIFSRFSLDDITFLLGFLITALLALMAYLYQRSHLSAEAKAIVNNELVNEAKERKKFEKALRETSAFRQAILNSANYMIISTDIDGTILGFNKMAVEMLGYTEEEVVGKFTPQIIHVKEEVINYAEELAEEGYDVTPGFETFVAKAKNDIADEREWTYVNKNGNTFPAMLSVTALRSDDDGEITGYLGIAKDITELKQANQKLLQTEQRFKAFIDNTPVVAYIKDDQYKFLLVNSIFEKRFNVKSENLIGKTSFDWATKEMAEKNHKLEFEVMEQHRVVTDTESFLNKDGSENYWLSIKFPIHNLDGTTYLGGVAIDVTESKRLEEELKEARDTALDSVRLKSEFLANMSHEIRTPMNGVLGMTEILLDTELDKEQLDYTQTIQESAESLLRIINDILDFSKIEAGKIVFEKIDFNLRSTVENVVGIFAEEVDRKGLEIASLVETDVSTKLQGDPGRLKQVLVNLVGNALKFTKEGSIFVKVSTINETENRTKLQFDISDTGIGMIKEVQKYLFQAFTQADGSMTRTYGGTGLGLAISKQLVEIMDGEISVESKPDKGSTFTFTAWFEKQSNIQGQKIIPIRNLTNLRALIVDDNATNREIISYQISSWGMIPSEADGATEALKLLRQKAIEGKPIDLVFLDLMMPDISGFQLAELIKDDETIADIKMILMPSFGKRGHSEDAIQIGIDGYLIKPIRQADLYDCISTVMGKSKRKNVRSSSTERLITHHTLDDERSSNEVRILIAEDNLVNQKVSKSQINRLGFRSDIVANGLEVIKAISKQPYSLILMDCQMPEMNGYEATVAIRNLEKDGQHIPIVAVTANAFLGEEEKCLAAGMDEYLAKPFKQHQLKTVIERCLGKFGSAHIISTDADSQPAKGKHISERYEFLSGISKRINELREEVGEEMVQMILSLFIEDSFMRIKNMHEFLGNEDLAAITSEAHSLKGSAANIGAKHVSKMCSELEMNAKDMDKDQIKNDFAKIESSFLELFEAIETLENLPAENLVKT